MVVVICAPPEEVLKHCIKVWSARHDELCHTGSAKSGGVSCIKQAGQTSVRKASTGNASTWKGLLFTCSMQAGVMLMLMINYQSFGGLAHSCLSAFGTLNAVPHQS